MNANTSFAKRHSLLLFFVLAYVFSWGNFVLSTISPNIPFLYPFGPMIAAIIMAAVTGGLKDWAARCLRWRVGIRWYAAALFVPAAIGFATFYLSDLLGGPAPSAAKLGPWYTLFLLFPMAVVDAPLGEETGWRGYALPRFSSRRSRLANTLILALLVMLWHVPLVLSEPALAVPYIMAGLASAILTNWVYYNANESALLAVLYHSAANTVGLYFAPMLSGLDNVRYFWMLALVNWVVAAGVVLVTGTNLKRQTTRFAQVFQIRSEQLGEIHKS